MIALYGVFILILSIYSYCLIDPNLTLINTPLWVLFRDPLVYFGYYQRFYSANLFVAIIIFLFIFHWYFIKNYKKYSIWKLAFFIIPIIFISHPFLSHDVFNYMFDARILTHYGQNPYTHAAANYPFDDWTRFMHWTERSYPYGPIFLPITVVISMLSFGKFILNFALYKFVHIIFYIAGVFFLSKLNKRSAVIFMTSPIILIEGMINLHNDFIGVVLGIIGIYLLWMNYKIRSRILLLMSVGIKYISVPLIFISKDSKSRNIILFISQLIIILYLFVILDFRPWYILTFFAFLPIYPKIFTKMNIFFCGLLLSYYPYIRYGNWDNVDLRNYFILIGLIINILYLLFARFILRRKSF